MLEPADYLAIATEITGLDISTLIRITKVELAECALHAPAAGFGEAEFYLEHPNISCMPSEARLRMTTTRRSKRSGPSRSPGRR